MYKNLDLKREYSVYGTPHWCADHTYKVSLTSNFFLPPEGVNHLLETRVKYVEKYPETETTHTTDHYQSTIQSLSKHNP